jgi:hypothetical protein
MRPIAPIGAHSAAAIAVADFDATTAAVEDVDRDKVPRMHAAPLQERQQLIDEVLHVVRF